MINRVRDKLKDNGTRVLCEAVDGQWSGIVFRDEGLRPLTLFELQHDSWLKFTKMSKENILLFLHNMSYVSYSDKELCSAINIDYFASHRYGNIEVHIEPYRQPDDGVVVRKLLVHSYCGKYNQGSVLNLLKTLKKHDRPDLWQQHLGVSHNLLQVLGILQGGAHLHTALPYESDHESSDEEEVLNLRADIVDESRRTPQIPGDSSGEDPSIHVSADDVKSILLGSHKFVLEDVLIALLCSEHSVKWSSYTSRKFYEHALSSTAAIYRSMTNHDLDIVINVLRKWECDMYPLGMKLNASKVQKANQLGFILGHTDVIQPKRTKLKMKALYELVLDVIKTSVPAEVL